MKFNMKIQGKDSLISFIKASCIGLGFVCLSSDVNLVCASEFQTTDLSIPVASDTVENSLDASLYSITPVEKTKSNSKKNIEEQKQPEVVLELRSARKSNANKVTKKNVADKRIAKKSKPKKSRASQVTAKSKRVIKPKTEIILDPLSSYEQRLQRQVHSVTSHYKQWHLNTRQHCPWEVLHVIVANGVDSQIKIDGPNGQLVTAIGWVCFNRPCQGKRLFIKTDTGFVTRQGPGLQGHKGQLLGMLAQSRVKSDYPIRVGNEKFTVQDLVEYEKKTCVAKSELTFKLIGLSYYLDADEEWYAENGEKWNLERLVREELAQPVRGAACGGTHRLECLSLAVKKQMRTGKPLTGDFLKAAKYVRQYQRYALSLQNRDGSFSTKWFEGSEAKRDNLRRLRTTGHTLEWLVMSLPEADLRRPEMLRAVNYLSQLMEYERDEEWDAGPLGHAINALRLYDEKVFKKVAKQQAAIAKRASRSSRRK